MLAEEKNHVLADSISTPQIARSFPDTTLPPPLATPRYSVLDSLRKNPCEVPFGEREKFGLARDEVDSATDAMSLWILPLPSTNEQKKHS